MCESSKSEPRARKKERLLQHGASPRMEIVTTLRRKVLNVRKGSIALPLALCYLLADCSSGSGGAALPTRVPQSESVNTMAATKTQAASSGPLLGCPYPSGNVWQSDVSNATLAAHSAESIQATVDGGDNGGFSVWVPDSEKINTATDSTPMLTVHPKVSDHKPYSPIPWSASFYIEPASDGHSMVLQGDTCQYYEGYQTSYRDGLLSEYDGAHWDLRQPFTRPATGALSTASGIPIGLLAVRPEELSGGHIAHALGWGAVAHSVAQESCVSPAGVTDCTDGLTYDGPRSESSYAMPYGAHIRLSASFDDSGFPREALIVAEALKQYGAYLYDTGCCDEIPFVNDQYGAPTWTAADSAAIGKITIRDFDVVQAP
jgi:hypothetical protein